MPAGDAHAEWVKRVLGFDPESPAAGSTEQRHADLLSIWRDAKDAADRSLQALARELRSYSDEDLNKIAEFGLFGLTGGGETVSLMAALTQYEAAGPGRRDQAAAGLRQAIASYRAALSGNRTVRLVDDNPFGVDVALQATLDGALRRIEGALA